MHQAPEVDRRLGIGEELGRRGEERIDRGVGGRDARGRVGLDGTGERRRVLGFDREFDRRVLPSRNRSDV
jgi:hypothetical protein